MSRIAFLGLGQMGGPMATRLLEAGHQLTVWNRTVERTTPLTQRGATAALSPAAAAAGVDLAITMLATPAAVEEVLFGPAGLAPALGPGQLLIEMSTIGPSAFRAVASRLPQGVTAVDAPVRGSVPEATEGRLQILVGASGQDFTRVRPILESLGGVLHVGEPGSGAALKLVVNLTLGAAIVACGEALALAKVLGLDRDLVFDVLAESPIGFTVRSKRGNVETQRYPPRFKLRHAAKDLRLIDEAARAAGLDLKATSAAMGRLEEAMDYGAADLDFSAVIATILSEDAVQ